TSRFATSRQTWTCGSSVQTAASSRHRRTTSDGAWTQAPAWADAAKPGRDDVRAGRDDRPAEQRGDALWSRALAGGRRADLRRAPRGQGAAAPRPPVGQAVRAAAGKRRPDRGTVGNRGVAVPAVVRCAVRG